MFDTETFESAFSELVTDIAAGPTVALSHAKRLVNRSRTVAGAGTRTEATAQGLAVTTAATRKGRPRASRTDVEFSGARSIWSRRPPAR